MNQKHAALALAASAVLILVMSGDQIASRYKAFVETLNPAQAHFNRALSHVSESPPANTYNRASITEEKPRPTDDATTVKEFGIGVYFYPSGSTEKAADGKELPNSNIDGYPIVAGVLKGSPADKAGITAGTIITSINNQPVAGLSIAAIGKLLSVGNAKPVLVTILGDDEPIEITPVLMEKKLP